MRAEKAVQNVGWKTWREETTWGTVACITLMGDCNRATNEKQSSGKTKHLIGKNKSK
jgi:hypothetical protein